MDTTLVPDSLWVMQGPTSGPLNGDETVFVEVGRGWIRRSILNLLMCVHPKVALGHLTRPHCRGLILEMLSMLCACLPGIVGRIPYLPEIVCWGVMVLAVEIVLYPNSLL